jgi:hypothetical protein
MAEASTAEQTEPERTVVYLGNRNAVAVQDGERVPDPGKRCTTVSLPGDRPFLEALTDIAGPNGLWANMSFDLAPAWVAASGPLAEPLTRMLAAHYGCEIREPDPDGEG